MVVVNAHPVDEKLVFDWAVTGLKPTSIGISAGRLPAGAIVGRNSFGHVGYSLCLPKGRREENFVVRLIALPHVLTVKSGFDAEAVYMEAERSPINVALTGGIYGEIVK